MIKNNHSPVDKPHDKLVRRLLSNPTTARELLDALLPDKVKSLIDLTTLERQPDTFVDLQHRMFEVDILFKAQCNDTDDDAYIWILIEQQREPDVWLPMRLFNYIGIIWEHVRKASKTRKAHSKLPFIYPLVISNASKPYHHSLHLRDLIQPESAKPLFDELFKNPIQLIDLAAIPDEQLRQQMQQHVQAHALLLSLKHVFDQDLQHQLETELLAYFQQLDRTGHADAVADMLYYLYNEGNLKNADQFWAFLHQKFSKNVEEKMMTLGQQAIQQAEFKKSIEIAQRMIAENSNPAFIMKVTGLSLEQINELQKNKIV